MRAHLIAIGSELLGGGRDDSNGVWLGDRLRRLGVVVVERQVLPDDEVRLAAAIATARAGSELVLMTGGLGPTVDDRTRAALGRALERPLERDAAVVEALRRGFARYGRTFHERQAVQADRPSGASWIANPVGTAPGIDVAGPGWRVVALPGVPAEMRPMFETIEASIGAAVRDAVATRVLKVGGRTESAVDAQLLDLYDAPGVEVTILAGSREGIELQLRATGANADEARERLAQVERRMAARLGSDLYGRDDETLPEVVGRALTGAGLTIATAESCTAGMIAAALTEPSGASAWFRGGLLVYSNDLKIELAGVSAADLEREGAVSETVARQLAAGACRRCGADVGVGVTGIAGPGGGSAEKPVGLVHIAVAAPGRQVERAVRMIGDRELVRRRTTVAALDLVRRLVAGG